MKSLGATILPVSLPMTPYALSAYYVIASAEASSNMARYDGIEYGEFSPSPARCISDGGTGVRINPPIGSDRAKISSVYAHTRTHGFGREVQKRILLGTYALTAE